MLDFVNKPEEILAAFAPYYRTAELSDVSDPNIIHDLQSKLDAAHIYTTVEVNAFAWRTLRRAAPRSSYRLSLRPLWTDSGFV